MEPTGVMGAVYQIADKVSKLAYINLLWILFSLMGLLVFGIFPATIAMFTVLRKIVLKQEFNMFSMFWTTYKKEFFKGNLLGIVLVMINVITYLSFSFYKESTGSMELFFYPMTIVMILIFLTTLFVFPVYVHFNVRFLQIFKTSFIFMSIYLLSSHSIALNSFVFILLMFTLPAITIFFGGSIIGLIIMASVNRAFKKNEEKLGQSRAEC